jgi:hypothetical protein
MVYLGGQLGWGGRSICPSWALSTEDWRDIKVADRIRRFEIIWWTTLSETCPTAGLSSMGACSGRGWQRRSLLFPSWATLLTVFGDFCRPGNTLFAFKHDGTPLPGKWPVRLEATDWASSTIWMVTVPEYPYSQNP